MRPSRCASADGSVVGSVELDAAIFGIQPNVPVMHQVVTAQLAARRSGTQSTKTRAEVRGGGRSPGARRALTAAMARPGLPHWVGGGVTHAPKPRGATPRRRPRR